MPGSSVWIKMLQLLPIVVVYILREAGLVPFTASILSHNVAPLSNKVVRNKININMNYLDGIATMRQVLKCM